METQTNGIMRTFTTGTTIQEILGFALANGVTKTEEVIKNTYMKSDAAYIISILNSLKG